MPFSLPCGFPSFDYVAIHIELFDGDVFAVLRIVGVCAPFQIRYVIIRLILVFVIDFNEQIGVWIMYERFRYKTVYFRHLDDSTIAQTYGHIPSVFPRYEIPATGSVSWQASHVSHV